MRFWCLGLFLFGEFCGIASAALNVLVTVPEWGALVQEIGGARVTVTIATTAQQDPHRIEARPSLIARARRADLVVATGADLEIAWLPLVLRESANPWVQEGQKGYFEAAETVKMLEVPGRLDRADGDVHAHGNPHIQLDPRRVQLVAEALAQRMMALDPGDAGAYQQGLAVFVRRWESAIREWSKRAAPLRGIPVLEQHKSFAYLLDWLGMKSVGTLEPKPGIEPTAGQLAEMLKRQGKTANAARLILRAAYQPDTHARWIAERSGLPVITLPFSVGGTEEARDLFGLFDDTLNRLLKGLAGNG